MAAPSSYQLIAWRRGFKAPPFLKKKMPLKPIFAVWAVLSVLAYAPLCLLPAQDLSVVIAEGKVELPTAPVAPLSSKENKGCSMVSVKAPGVRGGTLKEPDAIIYNPDSDISKVRGYASLLIYAWAEDDNVQFAVCNPTKYMILPGKAALLWQVWRSGAKDGKL